MHLITSSDLILSCFYCLQQTTLMRTHSAPADEHPANFELGSNGVRGNQFQSFSGQPVNMVSM